MQISVFVVQINEGLEKEFNFLKNILTSSVYVPFKVKTVIISNLKVLGMCGTWI